MKKFISDFMFRGLVGCSFGPLTLAIVYLVMQRNGLVESLAVADVCIGIFSMAALAFIAGGLNAFYRVERIPLPISILIHGCVLYVTYLVVYLLNDWMKMSTLAILIFTISFVVGFIVIWVIIFTVTKKHTSDINEKLRLKQDGVKDMQ